MKTEEVHWEILEDKELLNIEHRLKVSVQKIRLPDGRVIEDYYQVEFPESVIMVAVTKEGKVVMSRQYLHGFGHTTTVLPAGTLKPGEDSLEGAKRELLEETGYSSKKWKLLQSLVSHVNYKGSLVHIYLAADAVKAAEPSSGDLEEMEIVLLDQSGIIEAVRQGGIKAVGTLTGLMLAKIQLLETK